MAKIGSLDASSTSNSFEDEFFMPALRNRHLGLSISQSLESGGLKTISNFAQLRFQVQLMEPHSQNDITVTEVALATNYMALPLWGRDFGVTLNEFAPFATHLIGKQATGSLKPNSRYRMRFVVLTPINITNKLHVWLYCWDGGNHGRRY